MIVPTSEKREKKQWWFAWHNLVLKKKVLLPQSFRPLWVSVTAVVSAAALATTGLLRVAILMVQYFEFLSSFLRCLLALTLHSPQNADSCVLSGLFSSIQREGGGCFYI